MPTVAFNRLLDALKRRDHALVKHDGQTEKLGYAHLVDQWPRVPGAQTKSRIIAVLLGAIADRALEGDPPLRLRLCGLQGLVAQVCIDQKRLWRLRLAS